jgi:hypothetical protein
MCASPNVYFGAEKKKGRPKPPLFDRTKTNSRVSNRNFGKDDGKGVQRHRFNQHQGQD